MHFLIFVSMALFLTLSALGQEAANLKIDEYLPLLLNSLGGIKGASGLAVAATIVQVVMYSLRLDMVQKRLPKLLGKHKLILIYALSLVSGVLSLRLQGIDLMASLLHSNTLAAYQVLAHQAFKQLKESPKS